MADEHTVLFSAEEISATVRDLAASIDRDLDGSRLVVITVLKGAVMFSCDLVRATETESELVFLSASSVSAHRTPLPAQDRTTRAGSRIATDPKSLTHLDVGLVEPTWTTVETTAHKNLLHERSLDPRTMT